MYFFDRKRMLLTLGKECSRMGKNKSFEFYRIQDFAMQANRRRIFIRRGACEDETKYAAVFLKKRSLGRGAIPHRRLQSAKHESARQGEIP